ncbi:hypothetical protein HK104_007072, partial [Borealophlyctis nickersoniae]
TLFIPLLSPNYITTPACTREMDWAAALEVPILPFCVGDPEDVREWYEGFKAKYPGVGSKDVRSVEEMNPIF